MGPAEKLLGAGGCDGAWITEKAATPITDMTASNFVFILKIFRVTTAAWPLALIYAEVNEHTVFTRIRSQPAGRFRKYNEMRKFSVRLVNRPKQIWRGSKPA